MTKNHVKGQWITLKGKRKVFIREGQSFMSAVKASYLYNKSRKIYTKEQIKDLCFLAYAGCKGRECSSCIWNKDHSGICSLLTKWNISNTCSLVGPRQPPYKYKIIKKEVRKLIRNML